MRVPKEPPLSEELKRQIASLPPGSRLRIRCDSTALAKQIKAQVSRWLSWASEAGIIAQPELYTVRVHEVLGGAVVVVEHHRPLQIEYIGPENAPSGASQEGGSEDESEPLL